MGIKDPIRIEYDEKRKKFYLMQGRETFYDENREWIMYDTREEAMMAQGEYMECANCGYMDKETKFLTDLEDGYTHCPNCNSDRVFFTDE